MKRPAQHDEKSEPSLSLLQVARRWGASRRHIRRLLQQGKLPFEQIRGRLCIPLQSVRKYEVSHRR